MAEAMIHNPAQYPTYTIHCKARSPSEQCVSRTLMLQQGLTAWHHVLALTHYAPGLTAPKSGCSAMKPGHFGTCPHRRKGQGIIPCLPLRSAAAIAGAAGHMSAAQLLYIAPRLNCSARASSSRGRMPRCCGPEHHVLPQILHARLSSPQRPYRHFSSAEAVSCLTCSGCKSC